MHSKKLKCILVDSDNSTHKAVNELFVESTIATLTNHYQCPKKFLTEQVKIEYDVCMLNIHLPDLDGILVASLLNGKPVIFVAGKNEKLNDAIDFGPIDILLKPFKKERFDRAFDRADAIINRYKKARIIATGGKLFDTHQGKFQLFNVAGEAEKVRISLADIFLVTTDTSDGRNKHVLMRNGDKFLLTHCSFAYLESMAPWLIRVNKAEMISSDAVLRFRHDTIIMKSTSDKQTTRYIPLNRMYREAFAEKITK